MDRKLDVLQQILDEVTEDSGFYGSVVSSEEGLVVISSNLMDPKVEVESLAAKAASIINEKGVLSDYPDCVTIGYPNKKIFIQKISLTENSENSVLLIAILPSSLRYYKRKINKIAKQVWLRKDNPEGKIDAITAATISSRAVTDEIRKTLMSYKDVFEETSQ